MAFVLPTFNLQANIYTWSNPQAYVTPRLTVDCQLRAPSMTVASTSINPGGTYSGMVLLVPPLTDLRDHFSSPGTHGDSIEVPAGSGRFYYCLFCDDVGKGFPNEHRFAILFKTQYIWPVPMP